MIDRFFGLSKKIKLSVVSFGLGLIALCLILVGQSYAIFSGTTTDTKEQIVKLGNLEVVLNEPSTGIDLGLSPMSDVEGLLQEDVYSFSVENTGSANAMYKVLLIDDFLANREAAMGASRLIKESGADLTGIGILIEKSFQKGRKRLEDAGYYVYSQARVGRLDKDLIEFLPEDAPVLEGVDEQELLDK